MASEQISLINQISGPNGMPLQLQLASYYAY